MKKALRLLLTYLIFMIIGIAGGSILYSLYLNIQESVAGNKFVIFDTANYLKSLFFIIPCMCIIICPIIAYAHVRRIGGIVSRLFYTFLSLLTWMIILPGSLCVGEKYLNQSKSRDAGLTAGYFRQDDNKVYFFTKDLSLYDDSTAIVIDTDRLGKVSVEEQNEITATGLYQKAYPYTDVLVQNTLGDLKLHNFFDLGFIVQSANQALNAGWSFWLAFLSLGLLLCSTYALSGMFDWKLMNVCLVITVTALVIFVNSYVLINPAIYSVILKINGTGFFAFLGRFMYEPFIVLMNLLFSIIILAIGFVKLILKKKAK